MRRIIASSRPKTGPLSGVWELYNIKSSYSSRLDELSAAGCDVVMNYSCLAAWVGDNPTLANVDAYANAISSRQMKIMWCMQDWDITADLRSTFPSISSSLGATSSGNFVVRFVNHIKGLPATYAYYIDDEAASSRQGSMSTLRNNIRAADTSHPIIGTHTSNEFRAGTMQIMSAYQDIIGINMYPIGGFASDAVEIPNTQGRIDEIMAWLPSQGKSIMVGGQCNDCCVAYPTLCQYYPTHRWPSTADMNRLRLQFVNSAATARVPITIIMWYSYFDIKLHNPSQMANLIPLL